DTSEDSIARADTAPKPPPVATGDPFERRLASLKVGPDSDLRLNVRAKILHERSPCDRGDNIEFHLERGDETLDSKILHGDCRGACSPEEKREGREHLERLKRRIDAGKADPSQLDYNFTDCIGLEHQVAHTFEAPTPPLAVVVSEQLGPHDTVEKYARLVTVGCEDVQISPELDNPTRPNHAQTFSRMTIDATREGSTRHYEIALRNGHDGRRADGGYPMTARLAVHFDESTCEWTVP
ncbi:MAG: hypothetical protein ABEN55_11425, partial [Bradymonadaceae bacterium]